MGIRSSARLADDGFPHNRGGIRDRYAWAHSRVKALHLKNGSVAKARNAAAGIAEGECFLSFGILGYRAGEWVTGTAMKGSWSVFTNVTGVQWNRASERKFFAGKYFYW